MDANQEEYPATLGVEFPLLVDRLTTFFRLFTVIPIAIVLSLLEGGSFNWGGFTFVSSGGILFFPTLLLILFRQKYPRWWFDWNLNLTRFSLRVTSYLLLLRHEYPSTDEEQAVHVQLKYPEVKTELSRGMPLVKWFLAIPHYIVLFFLGIGVLVVTIIAWFVILFSGKYPASFFNYVVGVLRWGLRVNAYAFLLVTDKYPPFSLE